jgi:hypothetical protein
MKEDETNREVTLFYPEAEEGARHGKEKGEEEEYHPVGARAMSGQGEVRGDAGGGLP